MCSVCVYYVCMCVCGTSSPLMTSTSKFNVWMQICSVSIICYLFLLLLLLFFTMLVMDFYTRILLLLILLPTTTIIIIIVHIAMLFHRWIWLLLPSSSNQALSRDVYFTAQITIILCCLYPNYYQETWIITLLAILRARFAYFWCLKFRIPQRFSNLFCNNRSSVICIRIDAVGQASGIMIC